MFGLIGAVWLCIIQLALKLKEESKAILLPAVVTYFSSCVTEPNRIFIQCCPHRLLFAVTCGN